MLSGKWLAVLAVVVGGTILVAYSGLKNHQLDTQPGRPTTRRPSRPLPAVCETKACQDAAEIVLKLIDPSVDPCDDFYQFACGGYIRDHPLNLTADTHSFSIALDLQSDVDRQWKNLLAEPIDESDTASWNSAKKIYKACLDSEKIESDGVQPLVDLTNELGGWPIALDHWQGYDLATSEFTELAQRWIHLPFIKSLVITNVKRLEGKLYILVESPDFEHLGRHRDEEGKASFINNTLSLITEKSDNHRHAARIVEDINQIMEFETALYNTSSVDKKLLLMSREGLKAWINTNQLTTAAQVDWSSLLSAVLLNVGVTEYDVDNVVIANHGFLLELIKLLNNTPQRVIANTLQWWTVKEMMPFTNARMRNLQEGFEKTNDKTSEEKMKTDCDKIINEHLQHALAYKFVRTFFSNETKSSVHKLLKRVRAAFNTRVRNADWIDEESKALTIDKADAMKMCIGYPQWYDDPQALDNYYQKLNGTNNYFNNQVNLLQVEYLRGLRAMFDPSRNLSSNFFEFLAYSINAFNNLNENTVHITAAQLMPPYYVPGGVEALNYGSTGFTMGHEILHGFDDTGAQLDKHGERRVWWNEIVNDSFAGMTECFYKQYDNYRLPELDERMKTEVTVNGSLTLSENMADNGGLSTAFLAYQEYVQENGPEKRLPGIEQYTPEQLFFIGFAMDFCISSSHQSLQDTVKTDPHSPHSVRVELAATNSLDFSGAFACPVGSRMNPEKKCLIW